MANAGCGRLAGSLQACLSARRARSRSEQLRFAQTTLAALKEQLDASKAHLKAAAADGNVFATLGAECGLVGAEARVRAVAGVLKRLGER